SCNPLPNAQQTFAQPIRHSNDFVDFFSLNSTSHVKFRIGHRMGFHQMSSDGNE
ncbi:cell wall biogenesis protein phosphatase, partial [Moniliophthora roreri]